MARLTLDAMHAMETAQAEFGELLAQPGLDDATARRIRTARKRLADVLADLYCSINSPMPDDLVAHVRSDVGVNERQAMARIRTRRMVHLCEWCGRKGPDEPPGTVITCEKCRAQHADALARIDDVRPPMTGT